MPGMEGRDRIFELNDAILERIVFAMEDQSKSRAVDLRSGELVVLGDEEGEHDTEFLAPPPPWTPADGFKLMETFSGKVSSLSLRRDLLRALARGKGVFKAFRQVLAEHPQEEIQFREYKNRALRRRVNEWLDEMREALGLARLGPEPEDFEDLLEEEWIVREGSPGTLPFDLGDYIDKAASEAMEWLPPALAIQEAEELKEIALSADPGTIVLYIADEAEGPLAVALGFPAAAKGRASLEFRFFHVLGEFRALGLGIRLARSIEGWRTKKDLQAAVLRSLLLHPRMAEELAAHGHRALPPPFLIL